MNKNLKISVLQYSILLFFPILTTFNSISFNNIIELAGIDAYLSVIYAFIIGFILLIVFLYIFNYKPELSLSDKNIFLFGKLVGSFVNYVLLFIVSVIGIIIIYSMSNFIIIHYLKETPRIIILLVMGFIIFFNASHGIETIVRTSFIFIIIIILLNLSSMIGLITKFDFGNTFPFVGHGLNNIIKAGNNIVLNSILPIFILLIIPKKYVKDSDSISKYLIVVYFLSMLLVFFITYLTIGILGEYLLKVYVHPEYVVLKKISVFRFIDRIENIVYLKWFFNSFICVALIIYFVSNTIKTEDKTRIIPGIITLVMILLPLGIFHTNIDFNDFIINNYHYFNVVLLFIILLIFLNILFRKIIKKET